MQRAWLILLSVSYAVCMVGAKWPLLPSDPELQNVLKQLAQGPIARPVLSATPVNEEHYTRRHYLFNCTDVHCSGWLYLPTLQVNGSSKPPVVVMGHGLGGTKRWLDDYASYFAKNGFAVFSFDYRYWGGSEGQPRQWISVKRQLADWQSAVAFVQRAFNTSIDAQRLSLWGSSFAGGHVITTAATLGDAVKAVVSQVPHLDGPLASMISLMHRGLISNAVLALAAIADSAYGAGDGQPFYVPLGGPHGSLAIMQLNDDEYAAYGKLMQRRSTEGWHNLTRASLVKELASRPYSPIDFASKVSAPLLMVAAKRDGLCPFPAAELAASRARHAVLEALDCTHFDIYMSPHRDEAISKQLAFLNKHGA